MEERVRIVLDENDEVLLQELEELRTRVGQLEQDKGDLEIALATAIEHGDAIEAEMAQINDRLRGEIADRLRAEKRLENLLAALIQQKADLEILVKTITEHSDEIDAQWLRRYTEVESLSRTDALTGIANRRSFDELLDHEWRRGLRSGGALGVIMIDVDFFKQFNDLYGHPAGDEVLIKVAQVLQRACRRALDVPVRYGGEEFALVLPDTELAGAVSVAAAIRDGVAELAIPHAASPHHVVTVSLGVVSRVPGRDQDPLALTAEADNLLYAAKREGRNTYRIAG